MRYKFWRQICALLVTFYVGQAFAAGKIDDLLEQTDKVRSSDRVSFNRMMTELAQHKSQMSAEQFNFLQLLEGYKAGIEGNFKLAENQLNQLINSDAQIDLRFRAAFTLANIQSVSRNFVPAFTNLNLALSWLDKISEPELRVQVLISAAYTYSESGMYEESQSYLQQAKLNPLTDRDVCLVGLLYLQNMHATNKEYNQATVQGTEQSCEIANEKLASFFLIALESQLLNSNGQQAEAFQLLQKNLVAAEQTKYPRLIADYYLGIARAAYAQKQTDTAVLYLDKIHAMNQSLGFSMPLVHSYELQTQIAEGAQDFVKALMFHKLFLKADRSLLDSRAEQQIAYHLAKGELLKKNQQLALVQEQFRVAELENELKNQEAEHTRLLIVVLVILSFGLIYFAYRLFRRHLFYKNAAENDNLTQISNRFHFESQFSKQLKRCKQAQKSIGLIVFDLDHFKKINDTFGHEAGDKTLQAVVRICNHFIRSEDVFGRVGGEEFAIALPDCQPDKILMLAEICRDAIEQLDCDHIVPGLKISASFGVSVSQISGYSLAELMRNADQALYLAKHNGRNKVEFFDRHGAAAEQLQSTQLYPAGNGTQE
jgi:diguanylate cyclase (GGDEF)-like protein